MLRDRLKREGVIGAREVLLPAVDASGNSHTLPIAAGDTLVALRRVDRLENGESSSSIDDSTRIDYLAGKLSRERVKTTTLDLIDVAAFAERHAKRQRDRINELSHEL